MNRFFKIVLIVLAVIPIWLTIVAFAEPAATTADDWKNVFNGELLKRTEEHVQVSEILSTDLPTDDLKGKSFSIEFPQFNPRGVSSMTVAFKDEGNRLLKIKQFSVRLQVQENVPVAVRDLRAGELLTAQDFEMRWVDGGTLPAPAVKETLVAGSEVKSFIGAGKPILTSTTKAKSLIRKGDQVRVKVISSGIQISAIGVAQEPGALGQTIRVLNTQSKKELFGTVVGEKETEIRL